MDAAAWRRAGHCDPAGQHRPADAFRLVPLRLSGGGRRRDLRFNYMLPAAGVRGAAIIRTAGRYFERLRQPRRYLSRAAAPARFHLQQTAPLSPAGLARFRQGELLNRVVADVDTLDHLYLRVISPLVGALVVIVVVTCGLSLLDVTLALTLGGIMLATLLVMPPLFYRAGKPAGESMTQLRGQYRQQLTAWLQGQAELMVFNASDRYRAQMEKTELSWQDAQRRRGRADRAFAGGNAVNRWHRRGGHALAGLRRRRRRSSARGADRTIRILRAGGF